MTVLFSHGQHDELGGGLVQTRLRQRPVNYLNGGSYLPINPNWQDSGDGTYPHIVTDAPMMFSSGPTGAKRIHPTREPGVYIEIGRLFHIPAGSWVQASMNPLVRSGKRLTSTNASYDLIIDILGHGMKFNLPAKNGFWPANNTIAFPSSLVGLTRTGRILFKNGVPVAQLQKPIVHDANDPSKTLPITITFGNFGAQSGVIFGLPTPAQLTAAGITTPVIDPTVVIQPDATAGIDTSLSGGNPDVPFDTDAELRVRDTVGDVWSGLLKFDVSVIPPGSIVTAASESLWNTTTNVVNLDFVLNSILVANGTWVEGATWNYGVPTTTRWAGDAGGDGGADAGCSQSGVDFNATALGTFTYTGSDPAGTEHVIALNLAQVQAWVNGSNYGHALRTITSGLGLFRFASSDNGTAAERPELTVTYSLASGSNRLVLGSRQRGLLMSGRRA